jgi:transcriptional regulator with XRE-family HTH domain
MKMFSQRLKTLRLEKHLNQIELSKIILVGNKTISDYERGVSSPDFETLQKIASFFQVSTDYLLGKTDERTPTSTPSPKNELKGAKLALYNQMDEISDEQAEDVLNFLNFIKNKDK